MFSCKGDLYLDLAHLSIGYTESAATGNAPNGSRGTDVVALVEAVENHRTRGSLGHSSHVGHVAAGGHQPIFRYQPHQTLIGVDEGRWIGVQVGVVVLDTSQHQRFRTVVEKLGTAVEIGGVVLVTLDDEALTPAVVEAALEILGDASYKVARVRAAEGVDPRRDGGCGGLAVSAGNHQRAPVLQKKTR